MPAVTATDVVEWGSLDTGGVGGTPLVQRVVDAVTLFIKGRYELLDADEALWGADAQLAVIMQAARLYKRRRSPEGVAGFGEMGVVRISRIDPDVAELLAAYHVPSIAAAGGLEGFWGYWP